MSIQSSLGKTFLIAGFTLHGFARSASGQPSPALTQSELNRVINRNFSYLVTSNKNAGDLGTYASLDPVNALFVLKATVPLKSDRASKKEKEKLTYEQLLKRYQG